MLSHLMRKISVALLVVPVCAATAHAALAGALQGNVKKAERATVGELKKVDDKAKTIAVKTADGAEEVFKVTEKTVVHGAEEGAKATATAGRDVAMAAKDVAKMTAKGATKGAKYTALAGKEGAHVVVHYTVEAAEKTATVVEHLGAKTMKVAEGTIVRVDKGARIVAVKTADGAEEVFHVAERGVVDAAEGAVDFGKFVGKAGERIVVHYPEEGARKVAHLIKKL